MGQDQSRPELVHLDGALKQNGCAASGVSIHSAGLVHRKGTPKLNGRFPSRESLRSTGLSASAPSIGCALDNRPEDAVIAIVGFKGVGKTRFISHLSKTALPAEDLESSTSRITVYPACVDGQDVYLLDTPGFDATDRTDADILEEVAGFLTGLSTSSAENEIKLAGIVCLSSIGASHISSNSPGAKNIPIMFQKLCGQETLSGIVVLATTMWDVFPQDEGEKREAELRETDGTWGEMIRDYGCAVLRQDDGAVSAAGIIKHILVSWQQRTTSLEVARYEHKVGEEGEKVKDTRPLDEGVAFDLDLEPEAGNGKDHRSVASSSSSSIEKERAAVQVLPLHELAPVVNGKIESEVMEQQRIQAEKMALLEEQLVRVASEIASLQAEQAAKDEEVRTERERERVESERRVLELEQALNDLKLQLKRVRDEVESTKLKQGVLDAELRDFVRKKNQESWCIVM